jgi:hypothetical protein
MSLRVRAGGGGAVPGLPAGGVTRPAVTWPSRPAPAPPSSRGSLIMAAERPYRPLTERDRGQLAAARALPPGGVAPAGIAVPLAHATAQGTLHPVRVPDRGWRVPYWTPRVPGGQGGDGGDVGDGGGAGDGKGCC